MKKIISLIIGIILFPTLIYSKILIIDPGHDYENINPVLPGLALDALAALSLLGYCDIAYQGFCKFTSSNVWVMRTKVATCLLFYTGTSEAIDIVKKMYYKEKDNIVSRELERILVGRFNL